MRYRVVKMQRVRKAHRHHHGGDALGAKPPVDAREILGLEKRSDARGRQDHPSQVIAAAATKSHPVTFVAYEVIGPQ